VWAHPVAQKRLREPLSSDVTYCSVFKDDFVGPWVARHGLSGSDYQTFFNQQVAEDYYPIVVQGGGTPVRIRRRFAPA
jgi:Bacterial tandem repeat domain 1